MVCRPTYNGCVCLYIYDDNVVWKFVSTCITVYICMCMCVCACMHACVHVCVGVKRCQELKKGIRVSANSA